ncbi:glycosyltransferase [Desulfuromonas sp. AOP6]|uniref:glycosyltransferase n=1 Tax=Desulfuromonas sp. AOP6 TaxID=1566351 RepID=UPI00126D304E|nr:glycosyltransferase [Desulfuromonas sp. AOP6]BCA80113.1 glycosyl transferase [Desulfuromonas sp. AOP6]
MNICLFNSCRAWGGGEKWHLEAAEFLVKEGFQVTIAAHPTGDLLKKATQASIPTKPVCIGNLSGLNFIKIWSLIRWFKKSRTQVVILNLPSDLKAAGIAARLAHVPKIIYRRGSAIPIKNTFLNRILFKKIVTEIIANSFQTKKTILQNNAHLFPEEKIHVIYNGIDFRDLQDEKKLQLDERNRPVIIGSAGRLSYQKNQKALIDLAVQLNTAGIDFKIKVAGEGKLLKELEDYAAAQGACGKIDFIGFVENMNAFMASVDVFVLPSRWEGFGYVLIEAMAAGKPIVAFDVSSNPEIVQDGETGFLVPFGDIHALKERVLCLLKDSSLRVAFGARGRQIALKKFDRGHNLASLVNVLKENCKYGA